MAVARRSALVIAAVIASAVSWAGLQGSGTLAPDDSLPPLEGAYHGEASHLFAGGRVELVCSSHDDFTSAVDPPNRAGGTAVSDYFARFTGELTIGGVTHSIQEQAHMVERITFSRREGRTRFFETELLSLDFDVTGTNLPRGVMVRESPTIDSMGQAAITAMPRGQFHIESFFDVYLEISVNGGNTWIPADNAVHMEIGPRH